MDKIYLRYNLNVMPAQAGISKNETRDSHFRGNDEGICSQNNLAHKFIRGL